MRRTDPTCEGGMWGTRAVMHGVQGKVQHRQECLCHKTSYFFSSGSQLEIRFIGSWEPVPETWTIKCWPSGETS